MTLRIAKGVVIEPVLGSGRLGKGSFLPRSKSAEYPWEQGQTELAAHGQFPDAAVNDGGIAAVAWRTGDSEPGPSECDCAIRVDVGRLGSRFHSILLSHASRGTKRVLGVQVTPGGQVQVLYATNEHRAVLAEIDRPWRSVTDSAVPVSISGERRFGEDAFLIGAAPEPEILSVGEGLPALAPSRQPIAAATLGELLPALRRRRGRAVLERPRWRGWPRDDRACGHQAGDARSRGTRHARFSAATATGAPPAIPHSHLGCARLVLPFSSDERAR